MAAVDARWWQCRRLCCTREATRHATVDDVLQAAHRGAAGSGHRDGSGDTAAAAAERKRAAADACFKR
jgi:hypothetical protein